MAASILAALAGCGEDRTSNADDRKPIAVTASGIEIMEVKRNEPERIVEAVVVAGGEERQVTLAPVLDGPLPFAVTATIHPAGGRGPVALSYGWDQHSGAAWFQQSSDGETFEMSRVTTQGRVVEEYDFDGHFLRLEYAELPAAVVDKTIEKFHRGESLDASSPDVIELGGAIREFEDFVAQASPYLEAEGEDVELLTSLLGDRVFVEAVVGEDIEPARPDAFCRFMNLCAALSCRFIVNPHVCALCTAGSLACLFMDAFCAAWCGG
ncbi:MAG TPA: hypothetical protein VEC56_07155 [Candidatus Krumholzibacteria bacterium]|nr:hypothetical protein [Candidatus Krumholzibacteria bacterium]